METEAVEIINHIQGAFEKNPTVLFVIPGEEEGPSMVFAKRQVVFLRKMGVNAETFFLASRTSSSILIKEIIRFRRMIHKCNPDLIHAQYGTMTAFFCASMSMLPLVITYRGSDLNPCPSMPLLRWQAGRLLSQFAALRAKHIICVSIQLKERLWWKKKNVSVVSSGIDTSVFYPKSRQEERRYLGWKDQERVVLFNAGREPKVKGLDIAKAAVDVARRICGDIRFVVLDGYVDPTLIPRMMNAADCLLMASEWEGSPDIIKEALACNLPIVSTDVGDVKERISDVKHSFLARRDPNEMGRVLSKILSERERSNGYESIQKIAEDKLSAKIASIYQAILGGS